MSTSLTSLLTVTRVPSAHMCPSSSVLRGN